MQICEHCGISIDPSCDTPHEISNEDMGDMIVCEGCYNDYETFGRDFGAEWRANYERQCREREKEAV